VGRKQQVASGVGGDTEESGRRSCQAYVGVHTQATAFGGTQECTRCAAWPSDAAVSPRLWYDSNWTLYMHVFTGLCSRTCSCAPLLSWPCIAHSHIALSLAKGPPAA
jgi:hypothetical protein